MSRKPSPPISYGDEVALPGLAALKPSAGETAPPQDDPDHMGDHGRGGRRPILDKSAPTLVYIHRPPEAPATAVPLFSQGLKTKVHDLMIEALEEWENAAGWRVRGGCRHQSRSVRVDDQTRAADIKRGSYYTRMKEGLGRPSSLPPEFRSTARRPRPRLFLCAAFITASPMARDSSRGIATHTRRHATHVEIP